jgi:hypothetical protein
VPLDMRDLVRPVRRLEQIDEYIAELVPRIVEATYGAALSELAPEGILQRLDFGDGIAENEASNLRRYHVLTDEFRSVLNGSIRLVVGRKGSGKTAVFFQARDRWRQHKGNVVVDLKPEGYRLRKLRDLVLVYLAEGSQEQLLIAFWEYLLLVEIVQNILEEDYSLHLRDHNLTKPYQDLGELFKEGGYASTSDFSERMTKLIDRITGMLEPQQPGSEGQRRLSDEEVLGLIYEGEVPKLRDGLRRYLFEKAACYVLFDNLDKGWSSQGLRDEDVLIVRSLISACEKIERYLGRRGPNVRAIVFLRNDIYDFLVDHTPDRGKYSVVTLDWRDRELLKLLVQKRMQASKLLSSTSFLSQWHSFCVTHVRGEPSFDFLADRCLMRPRYLLRLINAWRTAALNREHAAIESEDIEKGLTAFSEELVIEADAEIRDVIPEAGNVLYNLIHEKSVMTRDTDSG